jgi:hypothetical protein
VLRLNFLGHADRPTVPNHNNMLNRYCRLRLVLLYIISDHGVYYVFMRIGTSRVRCFVVVGVGSTPVRGKFVGKILKRTHKKKTCTYIYIYT